MPAAKSSTGRNNSVMVVGLVLVIAIAVAMIVRTIGASGVAGGSTDFKPDMRILAGQTPPGYTPYGQPPKPGEVRPPYRAGMGESSR